MDDFSDLIMQRIGQPKKKWYEMAQPATMSKEKWLKKANQVIEQMENEIIGGVK